MMTAVYKLYVETFLAARSAIQRRDDARLHAICKDVAARAGLDSTVSLLAISDAEQGRGLRRRAAMLWLIRDRVGVDASGPKMTPIPVPPAPTPPPIARPPLAPPPRREGAGGSGDGRGAEAALEQSADR